MKRTLFAIIFLVFITACSNNVEKKDNSNSETIVNENVETLVDDANVPDYYWVQFGEDGAVMARAIFKQKDQTCPTIKTTDNNNKEASTVMTQRAKNNMPENFDITVCEEKIENPESLQKATLAGKKLSLPTKDPQKIVVIGDTGCRIKGSDVQDCNGDTKAPQNDNSNVSDNNSNSSTEPVDSNDDWNFEETITSAKKLGNTDLVLHVGDYIYREEECPDMEKCGDKSGKSEPWGSKWATWEIDFFKPAAPMLESAPWVFTRGNHEDCTREWKGYFLLLDPRPLTDTAFAGCNKEYKNEHSEPIRVKLKDFDILVLDSSHEKGLNQTDIDSLKGDVPIWVMTHVPLYSISAYGNSSPMNNNPPKPNTEEEKKLGKEVIDAIKKPNVKFLVSGHVHLFEWIQFKKDDARPPQMIAGGGATELDKKVTDFGSGITEFDADAANSEVIDQFTFAHIVKNKTGDWEITVMDQKGKPVKEKDKNEKSPFTLPKK